MDEAREVGEDANANIVVHATRDLANARVGTSAKKGI
jgi:hypothetical protein